MFNKSQDGFLWMESFTNFEKAPDLTKRGYRLDRMKLLLECFDNPQLYCKSIHIAGSKGKGSTGAFTASILKEAGFKTGVYSSPHISDYRERITIDGHFAKKDIYLKNMNLIKEMIEGEKYLSLPGGNEPTTFELLTLLAFLVFRDCECDWVVIETGLGGRLDATNLVNPEIVIITPVELEHTDLLGNSIEEIAAEKAGIIKVNKPVFSSRQTFQGEEVLRKRTRDLNGQFFYLPELCVSLTTTPLENGSAFDITFTNGEEYKSLLKMYGDFQGENCALAIAALNHLQLGLSKEIINNAISKTTLPGRMEIIGNHPIFMIDGAHTKISTKKLLNAFQSLYPSKGILIFGSVSGKDGAAMAEVLADHFQYIIISKPGSFKKSDPQGLFDLFIKKNKNTLLIPDPVEAEKKARELSGGILPVLTTGSFYMAAEIRKILK